MGRKSAGARREDVRRLNNRKVIGRAKSRIDVGRNFIKRGNVLKEMYVCSKLKKTSVGGNIETTSADKNMKPHLWKNIEYSFCLLFFLLSLPFFVSFLC